MLALKLLCASTAWTFMNSCLRRQTRTDSYNHWDVGSRGKGVDSFPCVCRRTAHYKLEIYPRPPA
ncbi:hypothetical protein BC835DRAFT_1312671 [Cytidiella melzeri]|nr:hypothetical protein BC835DRAFT_1312671 [Cytidiella melzeri]